MLSILIAMSTFAQAADVPKVELSLHRELYETLDAPSGVVGYQDELVGFRLGYQLTPSISVIAAYSTTSSGGSTTYDYYEEPDYDSSAGNVVSEYRSNHFTAGARFSYPIKRWLLPYVATEAQLSHGRLLIGDNTDEEYATSLVNASGFGVGGTGTIGLEIRTRPLFQKVQLMGYFETGAGITTPLKLSVRDFGAEEPGEAQSIGDLQYGGSVVRAGVGVRF